jgi:hypothetical protein
MDNLIDKVAQALCESDGADWDAKDFNATANGEEPEEQRTYWRDKARIAIDIVRGLSADAEEDASPAPRR